MLAAEDARAPRPDDLASLAHGLRSRSHEIQQIAVRAMGRLERPSLVPQIAPMLSARSPTVRREAANAIGQAFSTLSSKATALNDAAEFALAARLLGDRLKIESDAGVRESILRTIGRLPYSAVADVKKAEGVLAAELETAAAFGGPALFGAAKGLESLIRLHRKLGPPTAETIARLRAAVLRSRSSDSETDARPRRLALAALISAGSIDKQIIQLALRDRDVEVRRLAALAAGTADRLEDRAALVSAALLDASPRVRYEALRSHGRWLQALNCASVLTGAEDADPHVALLALDLLGDPCPDRPAVGGRLERVTDDSLRGWHAAAHAFVSLAKQFPDSARARLARFAAHPVWQVRMYAARAATALGAADTLEQLAADADDNVREAAVEGLLGVTGHEADGVFIDSLRRRDYQLVRTAARALKGTPRRAEAAQALVVALERLTAEKRDTSRDPRLAILERLSEVADTGTAGALARCARDFDPRIAVECATTLTRVTGRPHVAASPRRERTGVPSSTDLDSLSSARAKVTVTSRGIFELKLLTSEAPLTVARFVRLTRAGYYNGLTFHRVVPNFVIQGGSPGANEYMGDGDYMRDEPGLLSHVRGTVGISTRGRDTGDAQIFVNLADNPRLDHLYTVFAEVTTGTDVIDRVLEGDVIEKIEIFD